MAVYVDRGRRKLGRMRMCHMLADTLDELHVMADRLGVARRHFQVSNSGVPHYDICQQNRAKAIAAGAVEVAERRRWVMLMNHARNTFQRHAGDAHGLLPDRQADGRA